MPNLFDIEICGNTLLFKCPHHYDDTLYECEIYTTSEFEELETNSTVFYKFTCALCGDIKYSTKKQIVDDLEYNSNKEAKEAMEQQSNEFEEVH